MSTNRFGAWIIVGIVAILATATIASRYNTHRQNIESLALERSKAAADVHEYRDAVDRMNRARDSFTHAGETLFQTQGLSDAGVGILAVYKERIDAFKDVDRSLNETLHFVELHIPPKGASVLAHDGQFFLAQQSEVYDRATAMSALYAAGLNNPYLIIATPGSEFRKMGYALGFSAGTALRRWEKVAHDVTALLARAQADERAAEGRLDLAQSRNPIEALINP